MTPLEIAPYNQTKLWFSGGSHFAPPSTVLGPLNCVRPLGLPLDCPEHTYRAEFKQRLGTPFL